MIGHSPVNQSPGTQRIHTPVMKGCVLAVTVDVTCHAMNRIVNIVNKIFMNLKLAIWLLPALEMQGPISYDNVPLYMYNA